MAKINYHTHTARNYNTTTITEKRAPTDESVRLLKEMEQEARSKLIESIAVYGDNKFNCTLAIEDNIMSLKSTLIVKFILNGDNHTLEIDLPHRGTKWEAVTKHIVDCIARRLTACFLQEALSRDIESVNTLKTMYR